MDDLSGYTALANAVVEQAAKDLRNALAALGTDPDNPDAERQLLDCIRFFSRDSAMYTGLDGRRIMQEIYWELHTGKRAYRKRGCRV